MKKTKVIAGFTGIGRSYFKYHEKDKGVTKIELSTGLYLKDIL